MDHTAWPRAARLAPRMQRHGDEVPRRNARHPHGRRRQHVPAPRERDRAERRRDRKDVRQLLAPRRAPPCRRREDVEEQRELLHASRPPREGLLSARDPVPPVSYTHLTLPTKRI